MTDNGLMFRGYYRVPMCMGNLADDGAEACFQKDFYNPGRKTKKNRKYAVLVRKYGMCVNRSSGEVVGPIYEYTGLWHENSDEEKMICMNFRHTWSVDEVEQMMETIYQSKLLSPVI